MNVFSLSLDDMSPHPRAGGNFDVLPWCEKLIKQYPTIKIDFFVPSAYSRLGEQSYFLSQYPEWCNKLNSLPEKNYRINLHSHFHRRISKKYGSSNNNEVEFTTEQETNALIQCMLNEFNKAGLKFHKCFRAPGFHIGPQAAKSLTNHGFIIAGNKHYYDLLKPKVPNLKYVISNWDLNDECNISGDVLACGHTSLWCKNVLNEITYNRIIKLLESKQFEYKFITEIK